MSSPATTAETSHPRTPNPRQIAPRPTLRRSKPMNSPHPNPNGPTPPIPTRGYPSCHYCSTAKQAADLLSMGRSTIYELHRRRRTASSIKRGSSRRIPLKSLHEYIDQLLNGKDDGSGGAPTAIRAAPHRPYPSVAARWLSRDEASVPAVAQLIRRISGVRKDDVNPEAAHPTLPGHPGRAPSGPILGVDAGRQPNLLRRAHARLTGG